MVQGIFRIESDLQRRFKAAVKRRKGVSMNSVLNDSIRNWLQENEDDDNVDPSHEMGSEDFNEFFDASDAKRQVLNRYSIELRRKVPAPAVLAEEILRSPDAFGVLDPEGTLLYLNEAFGREVGRSRMDLLGVSLKKTWPDAVATRIMDIAHCATERSEAIVTVERVPVSDDTVELVSLICPFAEPENDLVSWRLTSLSRLQRLVSFLKRETAKSAPGLSEVGYRYLPFRPGFLFPVSLTEGNSSLNLKDDDLSQLLGLDVE